MNALSRSLIFLRSILVSALFFLLIVPANGQERVSAALFKPNADPSGSFFLRLPDSLSADTTRLGSYRTKSPTIAVLLSAVLPGAGQVYTGRYWKVPLILGIGGYLASVWVRQNDRYLAARSNYQASLDAGENGGQGIVGYRDERDFYHDDRDRFAFYLAITYLLNIIDAYVDASLYSFEVGDNLGGSSVKISIPFH
jgi:hypothetical protein